ncbi:MAG TPA: hypothetical protein VM513_32345 [Kofleriaceae bacterium]|nr:hypothetical protein [Kofleriaceae bacterium]
MAWDADTREHIEAMFASLSVFDVWTAADLYRIRDTSTDDAERLKTRERVRRLRDEQSGGLVAARREQARVMAMEMLRLKQEGHSYRAIAAAFKKPVPWVFNTIRNMAAGDAPPGRGRRRAA